jgi:hypothetical protein
MAAAADSSNPAPSHAVQTASEAPPIPLPPLPQPAPASPESFLRWVKRLDVALVVVVLAFAFCVASFPVYNSDFFLNIAVGRLLAQGQYQFGVDPFTFTTEGVYWVNNSWLFGLLLYGLYSLPGIGGTAVVVFKALLVVLLAWLMIRTASRPGQSLWAPAACTGLAVLALSPRLFLQPTCFSFLFLGLTLYLLRRPRQLREPAAGRKASPPGRHPYLAYWLIPVVCAFWVNLDNWFLLGPLTVGLYLLGESLQEKLAPARTGPEAFEPGEQKTLALVFAASIAACLINPHHIHAFTLPYQLGLTGVPPELADDIQFRGIFLGAFDERYFHRYFGLSIAGLAFLPLMALGVLSFVLALGQWRWWRAVLWLAFAALGVYHVRAIAFFAIVAAPITALNLLDFAAHRLPDSTDPQGLARRLALPGRVATLLLGLALMAATVPGWLQSQPYEIWRLGWGVEPNPGLVRATETIKQWQDDGRFPRGVVWYNTAPELSSYFAWYLPGERTFLDQRLPLYQKAAADHVAVRKALMPDQEADDQAGSRREPAAWRKVFRDRGIKYLVHFDPAPGVRLPPLWYTLVWDKLLRFKGEWAPLLLNGRVGVFGWKDPEEKGDPYEGLRLDFDRLAFGPQLPEAGKALRERPAHDSVPREWWTVLWKAETPRPLETDEAWLLLHHFRMMEPYWQQQRYLDSIDVQLSSTVGLGAGWGGALVNGALFQTRFSIALMSPGPGAYDNFANRITLERLPFQDSGPPSSLYLALRAARRALAANPDDAQAYLRLAQAYFRLHNNTREAQLTAQVFVPPGQINPNIYLLLTGQAHPSLGPIQPYIHLIRQTQIAVALHRALKLDPDLVEAYLWQVNLYGQMGYQELELKALQEYLRCLKDKPLVGLSPQAFAEQITALEKGIKELQQRVKKALDEYEIETAGKNVREKAAIAFQAGLVDTALKVLLEAPRDELYETANNVTLASGVRLLYILLLTTGRDEETRDSLAGFQADARPIFGNFQFMPSYDWFQLQIAAATGDYAAADEILGQLLEQETGNRSLTAALLRWDVAPSTPQQLEKTYELPAWTALMVGHTLLAEAPTAAGMPFQFLKEMPFQLQPPYQRFGPVTWPNLINDTLMSIANLLEPKADTLLLRAALALEAGETATARKYLRAIVEMTGGRQSGSMLATLHARPMAVHWLGWLEAYPEQ